MWFFWLTAAAWAIAGLWMWRRSEEITFWEWVAGSITAVLLAAIFQTMAVMGMTDDIETHSAQATNLRHIPEWVESYTYRVPHTVKVGKTTMTYYTTHTGYQTHYQEWHLLTDTGDDRSLEPDQYAWAQQVGQGKVTREAGDRRTWKEDSRMVSGDPQDDIVSGFKVTIPVTSLHHWENRVKAAPTVFSFPRLPPGTPVWPYPVNHDLLHSDRVLGPATITALPWDQMNARLGPSKHVNVILCRFLQGPEMAGWQKAAWVGGKKNDLVICYGGPDPKKPTWVEVFGWTRSELVKANLKTLFLHGPVDNTIIPAVEAEISKNFQARDWHEFDYITIQPPTWSLVTFFLVLGVVQGGLWWWFHNNDIDRRPRRWHWR